MFEELLENILEEYKKKLPIYYNELFQKILPKNETLNNSSIINKNVLNITKKIFNENDIKSKSIPLQINLYLHIQLEYFINNLHEYFIQYSNICFESNNTTHLILLEKLWKNVCKFGLIDESKYRDLNILDRPWKLVGFQRNNPSTDFRSMGIFGLKQLIFFTELFPELCNDILKHSNTPQGQINWFPFAITGINISFSIIKLVQNCSNTVPYIIKKIICTYSYYISNKKIYLYDFIGIILYCIIFQILQDEWVTIRPNTVLEFSKIFSKVIQKVYDLDTMYNNNYDIIIYNAINYKKESRQ